MIEDNPNTKRLEVHQLRLQSMKMKEIIKLMNATKISLEQLTEYYNTHPDVQKERLDKLNKHRKTAEVRIKRLEGLEKARQAKKTTKEEPLIFGGIKEDE